MNIHFHPTFAPVTITTDTLPHPGLENNSFILRWAREHPDRVRALCAEMGMSVAAVSADTRAPNGKRRFSRREVTEMLDAVFPLPTTSGLPPSMNRPNLPPAADNGPRVNDI